MTSSQPDHNPELRGTNRRQLKQFLTVLDAKTRAPLGRMVDISRTGMMLISGNPLTVSEEYVLDIQIPRQTRQLSLQLHATCVWSRNSTSNSAHHGSGFRFGNIGLEQQIMLERLIQTEAAA